jgi:hypothetical protein
MQGATPQQLPVLKGGMKVILSDLLSKGSYQITLGITILLVLGIVFVEEIPMELRKIASTTLGRLALFSGVLYLTNTLGWTLGLLGALFVLLLLTKNSRNLMEGFQPDVYSIQFIEDKKKWWVEEVLKERPVGIIDEQVSTYPVEDRDEEKQNKSSSVQDSRGQNSSIM